MKRLIFLLPILLIGCRTYVPIPSTHYVLQTVHDTTVDVQIVPIFKERTTKDTTSHLDAKLAYSDAKLVGGMLYHSLGIKDTTIPIKVKYVNTLKVDTIMIPKTVTKTVTKYIEKKLNWYQSLSIKVFSWLLVALILSIAFALWRFFK